MKTVIVYKSKYGSTKKYAEWLADELHCDIKENARISDITGYERIIFGGGVYAGSINGLSLITKNYARLSGKQLIIFAVGMSPGRDEELKEFWSKLLTKPQLDSIPHFYLRGDFDYSKLGIVDRLMMNMLKKMLLSKKAPTEDDIGLLKAYEVPICLSDKENLHVMLNYLK